MPLPGWYIAATDNTSHYYAGNRMGKWPVPLYACGLGVSPGDAKGKHETVCDRCAKVALRKEPE